MSVLVTVGLLVRISWTPNSGADTRKTKKSNQKGKVSMKEMDELCSKLENGLVKDLEIALVRDLLP
jgi:hypothetical protein